MVTNNKKSIKYFPFSKMDKNKCPIFKIQKKFWKKLVKKYINSQNNLKKSTFLKRLKKTLKD